MFSSFALSFFAVLKTVSPIKVMDKAIVKTIPFKIDFISSVEDENKTVRVL